MLSNQVLSPLDEYPGAGFKVQRKQWEPQSQDLRSVVRVMMRRRWLFVGVIACCIVLALMVNTISTPMYEATATIELNRDNGPSSLGLDAMMGDDVGSVGPALTTDLKTEISILKSDSLAIDVLRKLNLASQSPFLVARRKDDKPLPPWEDDPAQRSRLIDIFEKYLSVSPIEGTRLIQVTFRSQDPKQAARIANALIDSYQTQYLQSRYNATSQASNWLAQQLTTLKTNVERSEKRLTDFEQASGILTLQGGGVAPDAEATSGVLAPNPVIQKLNILNSNLTAAETSRIEKEAIYQLARSGNIETLLAVASNPSNEISSGAVISSGELQNLEFLQQRKLDLKEKLTEALSVYGPNNRHLKDVELQFHTVNDQILQELRSFADQAKVDLELAQQTESQIRARFEQQQNEASKLNDKTVQLALLSQEAVSSRKLYEDLYTRLQEANIVAGIKATNITVVDPARPQGAPVSPRRALNLELAVLLGLLLGINVVYLADKAHHIVVSNTDVEELTGIPVLGVIPDLRAGQVGSRRPKARIEGVEGDGSALKDPSLIVLTHPNSGQTESFRSLRTSVLLSRPNGGPRVLLITSCLPGEGKSTVTSNLAVTFAQYGKRVIIVEADMRRPTMRHVLEVSNDVGLSSVLSGLSTFADTVIHSAAVDRLDILPAGPRPPLPSELLGSVAFVELLQMLRANYDVVIIDSPPALMLTDAASIASHMDAVIWIARAGFTPRPLLRRAMRLIEQARMPVIGFLLNGVTRHLDPYGYDYEYGYSHKFYGSYYEGGESSDV